MWSDNEKSRRNWVYEIGLSTKLVLRNRVVDEIGIYQMGWSTKYGLTKNGQKSRQNVEKRNVVRPVAVFESLLIFFNGLVILLVLSPRT